MPINPGQGYFLMMKTTNQSVALWVRLASPAALGLVLGLGFVLLAQHQPEPSSAFQAQRVAPLPQEAWITPGSTHETGAEPSGDATTNADPSAWPVVPYSGIMTGIDARSDGSAW